MFIIPCFPRRCSGDYVVQRRGPRPMFSSPTSATPPSSLHDPAGQTGGISRPRPILPRPTPTLARPVINRTATLSSKSQLQEWLAKHHRRIRTMNDLYRVGVRKGKIWLVSLFPCCISITTWPATPYFMIPFTSYSFSVRGCTIAPSRKCA